MEKGKKLKNYREEKYLSGYSKPITYEKTKKILNQMENSICQIKINNNNNGTGTFCKIPFPDKDNLLPVLITNNHLINEELLINENALINLGIKGIFKNINLKDRIKYTNELYDITIIELKANDEITHYLEIDDNIIKGGDMEGYINENIYVIQYPEGELSVSFGILHSREKQEGYFFKHLCSTKDGSSGSPVLSLRSNKIIGIHKGGEQGYNSKFNLGLFLNFAIEDFIKNYNTIKSIYYLITLNKKRIIIKFL